jgi:hypothetical protein
VVVAAKSSREKPQKRGQGFKDKTMKEKRTKEKRAQSS